MDYTYLKVYCDKANITYREFAEMVGMKYPTITNIISGRSMAGKKARRTLNAFIQKNKSKIQKTLMREP